MYSSNRKNDILKPQVKITFPNLLFAIIPFAIMYPMKLIGIGNLDWITVTSSLWIYILWCIGWLGISLAGLWFVKVGNKLVNDAKQD